MFKLVLKCKSLIHNNFLQIASQLPDKVFFLLLRCGDPPLNILLVEAGWHPQGLLLLSWNHCKGNLGGKLILRNPFRFVDGLSNPLHQDSLQVRSNIKDKLWLDLLHLFRSLGLQLSFLIGSLARCLLSVVGITLGLSNLRNRFPETSWRKPCELLKIVRNLRDLGELLNDCFKLRHRGLLLQLLLRWWLLDQRLSYNFWVRVDIKVIIDNRRSDQLLSRLSQHYDVDVGLNH
jgi:hypothetical protein